MLRVGSRYETSRDNGISHLLEHMLYRGVEGHGTAHELALAFETMGGTLTAATGVDSGTLSVDCPPEHFEQTLALLARVYREPLLGGLAVEKDIIREEILEDQAEDGTYVDDYDLLRQTAFEGHPLGQAVIGTLESLDRFTVPRLRKHHARHYVGSGTVVAVAGPIDVKSAARTVERVFSAIPKGSTLPTTPPPAQDEPRVRFLKHGSSQTAVRVGFRAPALHAAEEPATEVLLRLLDDGNSTRLYARLCDERGLAYDVTANYEPSDDAGLFDIACGMAHVRAPVVLDEMLDVVRSLRDDGPSGAELAKAKSRHAWSLDSLQDDVSAMTDFLADATLRDAPVLLDERRERIRVVTRDATRDAARAVFRPENLSLVVVGSPSKRDIDAMRRKISDFV
jgi:predicted Zn-dependent peptidase